MDVYLSVQRPFRGGAERDEIHTSSALTPPGSKRAWDVRAAICAVGSDDLGSHSDEALVFLVQNASDRQTVDDLFQELFRRYQLRVTRWCHRMTHDADSVADLVQEVFMRAFRRLC